MLQVWVIVFASFAYLGLLFAIAYYADRRAERGASVIANPTVYALSLAVYCTTWTFYGSVGRAAATGIGFLPIYLGPTLMLALGWFVLHKMVRVAKANRITSIADFVASRYGKSQVLGGLVTVIAVVGVVPYIALQLKAVSSSFAILAQFPDSAMTSGSVPLTLDSALYVAIILAVFTILFGTRHLDATERHEGMVAAIAFESVVKLAAFLAVGAYVTFGAYDGFADIFDRAAEVPRLAKLMVTADTAAGYGSWATLTFLSMLSVLLLPRQFQIAVVENVDANHLRRAVWLFPLYLLLINIFVLPIALGGLLHFGISSGVDADTFVLTLPMAHGQEALALLVFIGGLSAATGMVIVETIALSTMVCNGLVMPLLLRQRFLKLHTRHDLSGLLLNIRRWAIALILFLGYVYFRVAGEAYALVAIGLISFAAVAQFAPVVIGGLYWKGGTREGALAGLGAGFLVWTYTLLLPSFAKSGWLPDHFLSEGLLGIELLHPQRLFGLTGLDEISHCLFWSLTMNMAAYIGISLRRAPNARELRQAHLFVDVFTEPGALIGWQGGAGVADLMPMAGRFIGPERAREAFAEHARVRNFATVAELPADAELVHFAEGLLAGAIGSAAARAMVASVVQEEPLGLDEVMNILDEASQVRAYSRTVEQKSRELERATAELREANERLRELDRMKDDFISTVTHELRTPLTSIRAVSEILHADPEMNLEDRMRFLGIVVGETERLSRLINQILDLARLESGRMDWKATGFDLRDILRESAETLGPLFRDKEVRLDLVLPDSPCPVRADRDRLIQVAINLLSNAVKFVVPGSGRVTMSLRAGAAEITVEVADNGPGIRAADRELIFEKFRQGGQDLLTDKPTGTGLGLPISRQIVEYFGGRLWVESEEGQGARFLFALPAAGDNSTPGGAS